MYTLSDFANLWTEFCEGFRRDGLIYEAGLASEMFDLFVAWLAARDDAEQKRDLS